jgi:hypothetical protein
MAPLNQAPFPGFQFPTTTPVPDEVFDVLMPQLSGAELKVLLYICRRTFGFKKESDTISLHQIAQGITTRDGRVLDGGTGLCKRHVQRALKVLEKNNIIKVTRRVDETGLYEVNTYSLNMLATGSGVETFCPYPRDKITLGVETPESGGVGTPVSTTTNSSQETVEQETEVVVAQDLQKFGIAQSAATKLIQHYPAQYIREKLEMAKGLVAARSALVSQNPAGWLRRAIEEDYSSPRTSERPKQHAVREKKDAKPCTRRYGAQLVQAAPREQYTAEEESQPIQNVPTKPEPEKTSRPELDAARENETVWQKALERVKATLPLGETGDSLDGTTLIQVTDTAARIGAPSTSAVAWLERRMYQQITKALKGVLGKDLDLQFVAAS